MVHFRPDGYVEVCANTPENKTERILLHRLVAVAEYGFDAVAGNDIHHINNMPADNRPSNLEPIGHGDHTTHHNLGSEAAYRDEDVLRDLYVDRGMNSHEVADELDTTSPTVLRWLRKHDIKVREPGR